MIDESQKTDSPFHKIRHEERGNVYWLAKEIAGEFGCKPGDETLNFMNTILSRAVVECRDRMSRKAADRHFQGCPEPDKKGNDYRLSFFLCTLIATMADDHWPATSEARAYFRKPPSNHNAMTAMARRFIADRCEVRSGLRVGSRELGEEWQRWCVGNGVEIIEGARGIGYHLKRIMPGMVIENKTRQHGMKVSAYHGIGLRD